MLSVQNIYKSINSISILEDVSINIEPNKITSLIGPSGSGKSSLLSCCALLSNPNSGIVKLDNNVFQFKTGSEVYKEFPYPYVSVVFQGLFLWPHLTNDENIKLALNKKSDSNNLFNEIVQALKIDTILSKFPNECSGGEKQRVALARQILLQPKYLLLDEITSALDVEMEISLANILIALKNAGAGILLVTHMIGLVKKVSDNFYFMDKGRIVDQGDISILSNPQTERLSKFLQIY